MALEQREVEVPAEHAGRHGGHPSPKEYVRIGVILGVLTALEIGASYAGVSTGILIPTLFILAIVKFALVVMWFMHLRFDDRRYARFFVMGLAGASVLYLIVLISLRVFA
ncbi:MAG TPA: cytochrome C oxidase subunit IV family protein [Actinomycetota bacterium]